MSPDFLSRLVGTWQLYGLLYDRRYVLEIVRR
jgi:hypothetical protein